MLAKVCGLTNPADAALAVAAGADLLGFVVHLPSPRHCRNLTEAAAGHASAGVLVTVGQNAFDMMTVAQLAGIHRIQPHVPKPFRRQVTETLKAHGFWVLLPWADEAGQESLPADLFLWEPSPQQTGVAGGSGQTHGMAFPPPGPFLLAGGLEGSNVRARISSLSGEVRGHCRGGDAASRLERAPGFKDPEKVAEFIRELKALKVVDPLPGDESNSF